MTLEANEATKSNVAATDFTLFVWLFISFYVLKANCVQVLGPIALAAACLQLPPTLVPLPPSRESFVILTVIFMVTMKILYAICDALPGIRWWWRVMKVPVKAINLGDVGNPLSVCALGRHARKHRDDIDSKAQDVEMAPG